MERSQRPSSAKRRAQLNSPTLALYWEIASKQRDAADESSEEDEDAPEQPAAGTTSLPMARRKSSLDQSDSPILHTLPGVDHVPDTPEDEHGLAAAADPGGGELRRQALRQSAEKGCGAAADARPPPQQEGYVRASDGLAPACTSAGAAETFTRDVTNLPIAAALRQRQGAAALPAPTRQQASTLPARPLLPRQEQQHAGLLGRRPPEAIPLAEPQQRPRSRRTSFLAGAKAALLEASAPSSQPGLDSPRAPPQRPQAAAGPLHVAHLRLRRSPLAVLAGLPAVPAVAVQRATGEAASPAVPRAEATPQGQLCLRPTPAAAQAPPTARTDGGTSILSDLDDEFLNRIASLERLAAASRPAGGIRPQPQTTQQQQQVAPVGLKQQQQQQLVGHAELPAVAAAPPSDNAAKSGWSDTPDSACLAMFEQLEQQAAGARAGAEASPVPARQLTFTPTTAGLQAAGAPAAAGATPLSSAGRSSHQPTSHLGRSALRQAAAAAPAGEDAELVGPPEQGQVQPPLALGLGQQAAVPLSAAHEKQQLQLDGPLLQPPVQAGHKRSLAAAAALEKVAAQYSPAAAKLQQDQLLAAASTQDGPVWKRLRSAESAQEQQSLLHQDQQEAAGGRPRAALPQAPTQDGHTAAAVDTLASFEYLCSDDESEDEEADRNLPLLTQYMQSAGRSPQQLRQQQEERQERRASRTSGGAAGSPGRAADASPGPSLQPAQATASPLQSADPAMLESYLTAELAAAFREATGIAGRLYDWQAECLSTPGVLQGKNLVYCAPTSGGKSLVAEVLMLRRILTTNRPAMLVLPFVSICSEKSEHLSKVLAAMGKEVKEFYGGSHSHAALAQTTGVIVCTIEKANIIINRMLEDQSLGLLSCLVVDELHMVGEEERGYQLELLLTKLRYAAAAVDGEGDDYLAEGLQIIGMSATLPNVDVVAKWLNARLFVTDYRPVPLQAFMKQGLDIKNEKLEVVRLLTVPPGWDASKNGDGDLVALLARETVDSGHSVLVFCGTKKACEHTAKRAARMLDIPERQLKLKGWGASQRPTRASLLEELKRVPGGADPALLECFPRGAAFHHAGLSSEEKGIVEAAYRCGAVSVLCATSTLAAGVNLPARRVIIRHAYKGRTSNVIDGTCYRQMAGRAGRAGIDTHGECILVNQDIGLAAGERLFTSGAAPVQSCLVDDKKGMKRAMLEVVVSGAVAEPPDVERYIRCTLLAAMNDYQKVADTTIAALRWLGSKEHPFIFWDDASRTYQPTPFGRAVLASGLPPQQCLLLKEDLARARQSFVLTTELHLTYLCVPVTDSIASLDWKKFDVMLNSLTGPEASVATKVGVDRRFAMNAARGVRASGGAAGERERVCKRFWMALILTDIIGEVPLPEVCRKFSVIRGEVQNLQEHAARFASMVAAFCERLGWYDLEALIVKFQGRVLHGVRPEILALTEVPFVKAYTARLLYRAGLRTPESVAAVENVDQLVSILLSAQQNSSNPDARNPVLVRRQALKILRGARELLNRRARELQEQAEAALQLVKCAGRAELAPDGTQGAAGDGGADGGDEAADRDACREGGEDAAAADTAAAAAGQEPGGKEKGAGPSGRSASGSGRSGDSAPPAAAAAAAAAQQASDGEEEEEEELIDAPPEPPLPPDPWRFGGQGGVVCLETAEQVREMCAVLLAPGQVGQGQREEEAQQAAGAPRYELFGFHFDTTALGSAAAAAAALPRGPTAAQRRDHAVHDRQSAAVGVRLDGVALAWRAGQAAYVPLHGRADLLAELAPLFGCGGLEKATWDLRGQLAALKRLLGRGVLGVPGAQALGCPLALRDPLVDVRVAAWLGTPDDKRLRDEREASVAAARCAPFTVNDMLKVKGGAQVWAQATQGLQAAAAAVGQRRADAARRAAQARKMWQLLRARLRGDELLAPLVRVEMPLVRVLVDTEAAGLAVDEAVLNTEAPMLQRRIDELEAMAHAAAGEAFALSSPQEVSRILFEVLKLPPPPCARDLKSGGWSTGQEVLLELHDHPIARIIFEHRKLKTLLTRFVTSFQLHLAHAEPVAYPGGLVLKRIRGCINQTCTDTGRLAMDEPNLQCVPKPRAYKVLLSQGSGGAAAAASAASGSPAGDASAHATRTANLRAAFVAPPGRVLLSADFRQIEFRLMAHFSGDAGLARIFACEGADPFRLLAAQWLGVAEAEVSQQQRDHAKQLTYGLLYGMGPARLADELGCGVAEARAAQDKFRASLPGIEAWQARVVADCRRLGYVETLGGRRRYLPNINCRDGRKRAAAERQAKNTVCQGSAADLAKAAMIAIHTQLAARLPAGGGGGGGPAARLVLQIHDEFLLEVPAPLLEPAARLVRGCMEGLASSARLRLPLRVRLAAGPSWGELRQMQLAGSPGGS